MRELVNFLSDWHQLGTAKRVILNGSSSGGKGTAGTCNMVGDMLAELSNDIDFRCIADAAGWIPLPVYNTPGLFCDLIGRFINFSRSQPVLIINYPMFCRLFLTKSAFLWGKL